MPLALCETFCLSSIALILAMHKGLMHSGQRAFARSIPCVTSPAFRLFSGCRHPSWSMYMLAVCEPNLVARRWT